MYNSVICVMAKNENPYIAEWVSYHLDLGFDHIYLYDNNDSTTESVSNFIPKEYLDRITIFNINDDCRKKLHTYWLRYFYNTYNEEFNWVTFLDVDEFLTGVENVNDFLNQDKFKDFNQIRIKWRLFGDSGYIDRDRSIPVRKFFTVESNEKIWSRSTKMFIRGHMPEVYEHNHLHFMTNEKGQLWKACLPSGKEITSCRYEILDDYSKETVFINHYATKTLAEFLETKPARGDGAKSSFKIDITYYARINPMTINHWIYWNNWRNKNTN